MKTKIIALSVVLVVLLSIIVSITLPTKSNLSLYSYNENFEMRKTDLLNKSPYAIFGDKTSMLMTDNEKYSNYILEIPINSNEENVGKLELNAKTGIMKLFDLKGNVLAETLLLPEQTTRFMTIDRFSEKYQEMTPYQYAANNPVLFIDVNGDSINVSLIQKFDLENGTNYLQQITNDLSVQTGLKYNVTLSGQLIYRTDASGNPVISSTTDNAGNTILQGSPEARTIITDAIRNTTTAYSRITSSRSSVAVGGTLININPTQISQMMDGAQNVDPNTLGMGMTFLHETLHSAVGGGLNDPPNGSGIGPTGDVVDRMNIVRMEMNTQGYNYGQRTSYEGVTFSPTGFPAYLPLDESSLNNLQRGIIPSTTSKFLQF